MNLDTTNITEKLNKPIVLIGMMGSGKTHLGKMLAESLKLDFYDSDHVIEERGGLSIPEIFELYGEDRFRQTEEKTVLELLGQGACVIATGGGAPVNPTILEAIKEQGVSVWLKSDADAIYERVKKSQNRPLLQKENPKAIIEELLEKREHVYEQADITVSTAGNNPDKALSEMIEAIADIL